MKILIENENIDFEQIHYACKLDYVSLSDIGFAVGINFLIRLTLLPFVLLYTCRGLLIHLFTLNCNHHNQT